MKNNVLPGMSQKVLISHAVIMMTTAIHAPPVGKEELATITKFDECDNNVLCISVDGRYGWEVGVSQTTTGSYPWGLL